MSIRESGFYRGVSAHQIAKRQHTMRDTRRMGEKISDMLNQNEVVMFLILTFAALAVFVPFMLFFAIISMTALYLFRMNAISKHMLVGRLPKSTGMPDKSDPIPSTDDKKFFKAGGIFHVGNDRATKQEFWLADKDVLTHMLIFGTTGSGKTETLVSLTFNAIALGSGLFYTDPKAAPKLAFQLFTMARLLGREHDFLVVSYSVKAMPLFKLNPKKMTNTMNPFSIGSAEALSEVLTALLPVSDGDNAVFSNAAQTMIKSLMYGLVEKRNKKELSLSIATIRAYVQLDKYIELALDTSLTRETQDAMKSYLSSVGWKEGMPANKLPDVARQHGFSLSYFGLPLASLTDTYGHIYLKAKGEVDSYDIIKFRRIAVILLPALEMSPSQLKNVGQITLSSIRNACSIGLGDRLEGYKVDVVDALPTNSPVPDINVPFLTVVDEYAAIPTPGFSEVMTQGRGLGIAAIVASQDYAGIKGADEKGAKQIVANTKVKLIMAMDDPEDTWELVDKIAGQVEVSVTSGYDAKNSSMGNYRDNATVSLEKRSMVDIKDLQSQIEGEFHGFFKGQLIRGQSFYAEPPIDKQMLSINEKIGIEDVDKNILDRNYGDIRETTDSFINLVKNGGLSKKAVADALVLNDKQKRILKGLTLGLNQPASSNTRVIGALMLVNQFLKTATSGSSALLQRKQELEAADAEIELDDDAPFGGMSPWNIGDDDEADDSNDKDLNVEIDSTEDKVRQKERMIKGIVDGVHLSKDSTARQRMINDVNKIEKEVNPNYDKKAVTDVAEKSLLKTDYSKPLPVAPKPATEMLNDVANLMTLVSNRGKKPKENKDDE